MGWTTTDIPYGSKMTDVLKKMYTWESETHTHRVLDSSLVHFNTWYAAVERIEKDSNNLKVIGLVVLVRKDPRYPEFSYKDLDENMGPRRINCPERILKLLTPTTNKHALQWRQNCWAIINSKKKNKRQPLKTGYHVIFDEPLPFQNGDKVNVFYIKDGKRRRYINGYTRYILSNHILNNCKYNVVKLKGLKYEDLPTLIGISPAVNREVQRLINLGKPVEENKD